SVRPAGRRGRPGGLSVIRRPAPGPVPSRAPFLPGSIPLVPAPFRPCSVPGQVLRPWHEPPRNLIIVPTAQFTHGAARTAPAHEAAIGGGDTGASHAHDLGLRALNITLLLP